MLPDLKAVLVTGTTQLVLLLSSSLLEMLPCSQVILTNETEDTAQPYREIHAPDFDLTAADVDTATLFLSSLHIHTPKIKNKLLVATIEVKKEELMKNCFPS